MNLDSLLGNNYKPIEGELWSSIPLWIPTGAVSLDYAIGGFLGKRGGIPLGKITEISGAESSGKSTLLDHIARNILDLGGIFLLGDPEDSHAAYRMREIGIEDGDNFRIMEPPDDATKVKEYPQLCIEDFFVEIDRSLKKIRKVDRDVPIVYGLDSLASIGMREVLIEGTFSEKQKMNETAAFAQYLSQKLKAIDAKLSRNRASLIFVNQLRDKLGVMFGDKQGEPGGRAVKFHAALRIRLGKGSKIKAKDDPTRDHELDTDSVGLSCRFEVKKNKIGRPYCTGGFPLYFDDRGILNAECLVDLIKDRNKTELDGSPLKQEGHSYTWYGDKIAKNKKELIQRLDDNEELAKEIEEELFLEEEDED